MEHPLEALERVDREARSFREKAGTLAARLAVLEEKARALPPPPAAAVTGWRIRLGLFWLLVLSCALAAFTAGYIIARAANDSDASKSPPRPAAPLRTPGV